MKNYKSMYMAITQPTDTKFLVLFRSPMWLWAWAGSTVLPIQNGSHCHIWFLAKSSTLAWMCTYW